MGCAPTSHTWVSSVSLAFVLPQPRPTSRTCVVCGCHELHFGPGMVERWAASGQRVLCRWTATEEDHVDPFGGAP
jgi:hypothetical protein